MSREKIALVAEQYFSTLNPIASRMYTDFRETRNTYEYLWDTLSGDEQTQILNECIIKPEVTLKYSLETGKTINHSKNNEQMCFGLKNIVDDFVSYRDEHSAPFSFKTLSQIDLRLFHNQNETKTTHNQIMNAPPPQQQLVEETEVETIRYKIDNKTEKTSLFGKLLRRRPTQPDAEQQVLVSPNSSTSTSTQYSSTLPKTGLDFLDNW